MFWLQGQGCTGCSVSILNSMHPAIAEVLLKIISLDFHPTIMADEGAPAIEFMRRRARENDGGFFIVVEGAVSDLEGGRYCVIGESGHEEITMSSMLKELAPHAAAVLAVGACAAYGGVSAARGAGHRRHGGRRFLREARHCHAGGQYSRLSAPPRLDGGHAACRA